MWVSARTNTPGARVRVRTKYLMLQTNTPSLSDNNNKIIKTNSKYIEAWNFMEVYFMYTTTYVCKQRVVALLLMELLSKMRKMRTITPPDAS